MNQDNNNKNLADRLLNFTNSLQKPAARKVKKESTGPIYGDITNRLFAVIVDLIILLPVAIIPGIFMRFSSLNERSIYLNGFQLVLIIFYTIPFIYKFGATPGKIVFGLKVVDKTTGGKLSLSQTVIRCLSYITAPIGLLAGSVRKDKRCWHDFLADTVVIYSPNRWYKRHTDTLIGKVKKYFNR